jgi:hypothetical protein
MSIILSHLFLALCVCLGGFYMITKDYAQAAAWFSLGVLFTQWVVRPNASDHRADQEASHGK